MILPTLDYEKKYWSEGLRIIAGIDEAGRGPLAGPVMAAAVVVYPDVIAKIKNEKEFTLIRDSKMLSAKQRERAYNFIANNFAFGVGWSSHETIDRVNVMQATFLAMKKALSDLRRKFNVEAQILLVDGRSVIPNLTLRQENVTSGDKFVLSISAASVIAKVTRDRIMLDYHDKFPQYGFARHKGYGTELHFKMIGRYGPCEIHRKSFRLRIRQERVGRSE